MIQVLHTSHSPHPLTPPPHTQTHNQKPSKFFCPCVRGLFKRRKVDVHLLKMLENHWSGLIPCSRAFGCPDHLSSPPYPWNCFPLGLEGEVSMWDWPQVSTDSPHHAWTVSPGLFLQAPREQWAVSSPMYGGQGHWSRVASCSQLHRLAALVWPATMMVAFFLVAKLQIWPWLCLQPCGGSLLSGLPLNRFWSSSVHGVTG